MCHHDFAEYPKFSIITPSYNQAEYIEETICSVISQDYPCFEYIVVDGSSSDGTHILLDRYKRFIDITVIEPDRGQADAINKGMQLSSGSYIMWLNSDDVLLPGSLKEAARVFRVNPSLLLLHGHSILFGSGVQETLIGVDPGDFCHRYPAYIPFPQPASFFSKTLIEHTGPLDASLHYAMDYELLLRAYLTGDIRYHPYTFSKYRIHPSSKTHHTTKFVHEWRDVFSRFLSTVPHSSDWISKLRQASLYHQPNTKYPLIKDLGIRDLDLIVFNHLLVCAHMLYQAGIDRECRDILRFIRRFLPSYYTTHRLSSLFLRSLVLPSPARLFLKRLIG